MTLLDLINMMRERGVVSPDAVVSALEEIDRRLSAIEGVKWEVQSAPAGGGDGAPPCVARWEMLGTLQGQPCIERGPRERHRTALVGGIMGEWSDSDG